MLQPKRVKYRRPQDGRGNKGNAHRGTQLAFGSFGIKTLEPKWIDSRQIEAARVALNRYMNRQGQVWICRGEVYGKADLTPSFSQDNKSNNNRGNGRSNNRGGNRKRNNNR